MTIIIIVIALSTTTTAWVMIGGNRTESSQNPLQYRLKGIYEELVNFQDDSEGIHYEKSSHCRFYIARKFHFYISTRAIDNKQKWVALHFQATCMFRSFSTLHVSGKNEEEYSQLPCCSHCRSRKSGLFTCQLFFSRPLHHGVSILRSWKEEIHISDF